MTFGALIQFYNELPENLPRAVSSVRKLCAHVVGYDDGSTDGSGEWGAANLDVCIRGAKNDWQNEIAHKALLLEELRKFEVDWVLWIDADEALSPAAVERLPTLATTPGITGICIPEVNLWRSKTHFRVDMSFGNAGFLRCWRMTPELRYDQDQIASSRLHQWQFPVSARTRMVELPQPGISHVIKAGMEPDDARRAVADYDAKIASGELKPDHGAPMVHYSWDSVEKIKVKYDRYAAMGQCDWNLERLADRPDAVLVPAPREWFWSDAR